MIDNDKLSFSLMVQEHIPSDYAWRELNQTLAYKLVERLGEGQYNTVMLRRRVYEDLFDSYYKRGTKEYNIEAVITPVQQRHVVMYSYEQMDWRKLSITATQEIKRRIRYRLTQWWKRQVKEFAPWNEQYGLS